MNRFIDLDKESAKPMAKVTLRRLQRHLYKAADILRNKMNAWDYQNYIFGMLFLKRASDEFDYQQAKIIRELIADGMSEEDAKEEAQEKDLYVARGVFYVPEAARWKRIRDEVSENVGQELDIALGALQNENIAILKDVLDNIHFANSRHKLKDKTLLRLIKHFNKVSLCSVDFEFPDLPGAVYEYLIKAFADKVQSSGGEYYTPRDVVRLMVRLVKPQEGMTVYDPTVGSGGMLILSKEYIEAHGSNSQLSHYYGQESNPDTYPMCKLNLILHGITSADIKQGDTLTDPQHKKGGELIQFDRVLANPPFSADYEPPISQFSYRFNRGAAPSTKADLMFVQHMHSSLNDAGMMATVIPHGVLFRGSGEKAIRKAFVDEDLIEAIIALPENLFYGASIGACILVMRAKDAKPEDRKGQVLFINADREYDAGRAQNYLRPEHIEKIANTFDAFADVDGYAKVVSIEKLQEEDYNLNVKRYADNSPPPEPHDVRAHLIGGVPKAEVHDEAAAALMTAHGLQPSTFLVERDEDYYDFDPALEQRSSIKERIEADPGVVAQEAAIRQAFDAWWTAHSPNVRALPASYQQEVDEYEGEMPPDERNMVVDRLLMGARRDMLTTFDDALLPVGLLDSYKLNGVVVSWLFDQQYDMKTLVAQGFDGLIESLVESIRAVVAPEEDEEPDKDAPDPFEHRLVTTLLADYLDELRELKSKVAELNAQKEEWELGPEDEQEDEDDEEDGGKKNYAKELKDEKKELTEKIRDDLKRIKVLDGNRNKKGSIRHAEASGDEDKAGELRTELYELNSKVAPEKERIDELTGLLAPYEAITKELRETRRAAKLKEENLLKRLEESIAAMSDEAMAEMVMGMLNDEFLEKVVEYVSAHRRDVIAFIEELWDKYSTDLKTIEDERNAAADLLRDYTEELSYVVG